ncbi:MAG: Replication-associated recombination protein, partial [Bacteroidota bacterium]
GKTSLAQIIAQELKRPFFLLSAINSGVKEIRDVLEKAKGNLLSAGKTPLLFIDEIHRFSKSQQDSLLPAVEKGVITLIGATTENPSFEIIGPLLSRCQVYTLHELTKLDLMEILQHALKNDGYLQQKKIEIKEWEALLRFSGGDARKLLNLAELIINTLGGDVVAIDNDTVAQILQKQIHRYDKQGELHYDLASALIKSIRGSDPNAGVYYLARMLKGGEDPLFIARRLVILAAEDIGNANPTAIIMANNIFDACSKIGMPEARIMLSQLVTYLACSNKSNSAYMAIAQAYDAVDQHADAAVPLPLRNAPTALMKELGYGKSYGYSHLGEDQFIDQEFLPDALAGKAFYTPGNNARELEMRAFLKQRWKSKYGY